MLKEQSRIVHVPVSALHTIEVDRTSIEHVKQVKGYISRAIAKNAAEAWETWPMACAGIVMVYTRNGHSFELDGPSPDHIRAEYYLYPDAEDWLCQLDLTRQPEQSPEEFQAWAEGEIQAKRVELQTEFRAKLRASDSYMQVMADNPRLHDLVRFLAELF